MEAMLRNLIIIGCMVAVLMYLAGVSPDDVSRTMETFARDASAASLVNGRGRL